MIDYIKQMLEVAGNICLSGLTEDLTVKLGFKNAKDLVTLIDRRVEEYIVARIKKRFPDHDIIGEESGSQLSGSDYQWIIDPIDGTTSYFHHQPYFSVSIALQIKGEIVYGGVYAPALKQMFLAQRGDGATLNGSPIQVSASNQLVNCVLATGFACLRSGQEHNNLTYFNRIMPEIRDVRRCGSAALDLAYVAAGKYDGFWELNLNNYDVAAGILLVLEAGGQVYDFNGGKQYPEQGIIATNGCIDREFITFFQ